MKFFVAVIAMSAAAAAVPAGLVNTGHSAQYRSQDSLGNYAFGYNEDHATGGTFRRESGSPGMAEGSYGLRDIDGRVRVVNYVADAQGYRANVQTNEPGVDPTQDPASVLINKAAAIVAPYISKTVVAEAAPLAIQQSIEAPIVQKYEAAPIIEQAPIVQQYEQAPIVQQYESAPIVQKYESAPIVQQYEQAPIVQQYESAPIVQKYEAAPIIEQAPIVQQYESAPAIHQAPIVQQYESAPVLSAGYTTKTYAAPAPILSAPMVHSAPIAHAGAYPAHANAYGAHAGLYGAPAVVAHATKGIAHAGPMMSHLSPAFAAKTLHASGHAMPLIKKK